MRPLGLAALAALMGCVTASGAGVPLSPREQALVALQRGDTARAVELLEALSAQAPSDLDVARALAEAHVKHGTASTLLARVSPLDTAAAHYTRGLLLYANAKDATGPAVDAFTAAIARAPTEGELQYRLGLALLESEKYDPAIEHLSLALKSSPTRTAWNLPLAKALYRSGKSREAIAAVRVVVTNECTTQEASQAKALMEEIADPFAGFPKVARPKLDQALSWLQTADIPQQAITELEDIVREYPDLGVVHALLGLAAARVDDAGRAIEEFRRAIELTPDDGKPYLYLADLYANRQRGPQARELYEKALEKNPCLESAWFKLGDLALERQELDKARQAFRTSVRLDPTSWPARGKLALVYQLESNWPGADRELKAEVELHPDNLEAVLRLGLLHTEKFLKAKQQAERTVAKVEAGKWLEKVLEQQPDNVMASRALERVNQP